MEPSDFGLVGIDQFREVQIESALKLVASDERFVALCAPTGVGKSLIAYLVAKLLRRRTVILTASLGLEDQYLETLKTNVAHIRGRANYPCWEGGNCLDGYMLGCGDKTGCPYLAAYTRAKDADIVLTNYAYWLSMSTVNGALVNPDVLILDEAHLAVDWLSKALDFTITERGFRRCGANPADLPHSEHVEPWIAVAPHLVEVVANHHTRLKYRLATSTALSDRLKLSNQIKELERFLEACQRLDWLSDNWVVTQEEGTDIGRVWSFKCIRPAQYREKLLKEVPKVVMLSATIRPKTLVYLGVPRMDCDFTEIPKQFADENGPVYHYPTTFVDRKMSSGDMRDLITRCSEICTWAGDRKGIIHTVSYKLAKEIAKGLACVDHLQVIVNGSADPDAASAQEAYQKFSMSGPGTVLVSPSFSTGWDFKYDLAEYQIIAKLAYPNLGDKVVRARNDADRGAYLAYQAAQDLQQACGRIVRAHDDLGVTFILDNHVTRLLERSSLFPKYFNVQTITQLPALLPKL